MKTKTQDLIGPALDWAVAKCEGIEVLWSAPHEQLLRVGLPYSPFVAHRDWTIGGPIIAREEINLEIHEGGHTRASFYKMRLAHHASTKHYHHQHGDTPLIAAMRTYVLWRLGDEVDVPEELCAAATG